MYSERKKSEAILLKNNMLEIVNSNISTIDSLFVSLAGTRWRDSDEASGIFEVEKGVFINTTIISCDDNIAQCHNVIFPPNSILAIRDRINATIIYNPHYYIFHNYTNLHSSVHSANVRSLMVDRFNNEFSKYSELHRCSAFFHQGHDGDFMLFISISDIFPGSHMYSVVESIIRKVFIEFAEDEYNNNRAYISYNFYATECINPKIIIANGVYTAKFEFDPPLETPLSRLIKKYNP